MSSRALLCLPLCLVLACSERFVPPEQVVMLPGEPGVVTPEPEVNAFLELTPPLGALVEGGAPTFMEARLLQPPTAPVTLSWTTSAGARGSISPESLTIQPEDWEAPVRVEVAPDADDDIAQGAMVWEVRTVVSSEDARFSAVMLPVFEIETIDNDVAPVLVAAAQGPARTSETGETATLLVSLSRQPSNPVVIPVASSNPLEGTTDVEALTFTRLDWNITQVVTVTGVDDKAADGDQAYSIEFGDWNSEDEAFNGVGAASVSLTNVDGVCGNGVVDGSEPCEPGDQLGCAFGDETCQVCDTACAYVDSDGAGFCGDGQVQSNHGEQCDEATRACAYGERSCTTCSDGCARVPGQLTGFCGDGQVQVNNGEQCDGPTEPCAYGERSCVTCSSCREVPGQVTGFCGDGQANNGEQCDGPTEPCAYGELSCVTCSASCTEIPGQVVGYCGDGQVQSSQEACEGTTNEQCPLYGTMACGGDCQLDTSGCIGAVDVSLRWDSACMALSDGEVLCWGDDAIRQVVDAETDVESLVPTGFDDIYCVIRRSGSGSCVGLVNTSLPHSSPVDVKVRAARGADGQHWPDGFQDEYICSLNTQGEVKCDFKLHTSYQNRPFGATCGFSHSKTWMCNPIRAVDNQGFVQLEMGNFGRACVRKASGETHCWKERGWSFSSKKQGSYKSIALEGWDACGVRTSDGGIDCWEVGESTITNPTTATGFVGVSMWSDTSGCGITAQGMTCWGNLPTNVPASVSGSFSKLSTDSDMVCAVGVDGGLQCWGDNSRNVLNIPTVYP